MKYFGRKDFREGRMYPVGFHWGYIFTLTNKARLEHYIVLRIPTFFRKDKLAYDVDLIKPHVWTMLAFAAWPYKTFEGRFRSRLTHFWVPDYGS